MRKGIFKIQILASTDAERLARFYEVAGRAYQGTDFARLCECVQEGCWSALIAHDGAQDIGAAYVNWQPKYHLYRRLRLPELQDLRVLPTFRRRGAASALINAATEHVRAQGGAGLGISVGLSADYGPAQRLYVHLGFVPDGLGVTYDRQAVPKGTKACVDDDLALMMMKMF